MSKKLYLKKNVLKVLANGTRPYYCDTCPCQQPIPIGHYFADFVEYNWDNYMILNPADLFIGDWTPASEIFETQQYQYVYTLTPSWTPSAICVPQNRFYNGYIDYMQDYGVRNSMIYTTRELRQVDNNYVLDVPLYKQDKWWNGGFDTDNTSYGVQSIVSGNTAGEVIDNFNLSTMTVPLEFRKGMTSGLISTIIVNNVDNTFELKDFITVSSLNHYALSCENLEHPVIVTNVDDQNYIPLMNKSEASVQYYLARVYEGDQEGYIFSEKPATEWQTGNGYKYPILQNNILAGRDNVPISGKTYYFRYLSYGNEEYWRQVRKVGNKYFGYSLDDSRTIVEFPATGIVSAKLYDDEGKQIIVGTRINYGINAFTDDNYYGYPILYSSDGTITVDQYVNDWYNYPDQDPQEIKIEDENGHYFFTEYGINEGETEYIEDSNDYINWWYQVNFLKDYNTATYTATIDVVRLGYYYNDELSETSAIFSDPIPSTFVLTARVADWYDYQYIEQTQPTVHWDPINKQFFYYEGGETPDEGPVHPDFINLAFDLPIHDFNGNITGSKKLYVYKAPQWGVIESRSKNASWADYIVTGYSFDTVRVWNEINKNNNQEPNVEMPVSTGFYINKGYPNSETFYSVHSGANYWYVLSGNGNDEEIPLTGGCSLNPQKSIAVDDPNKPPYWFFNNDFDGNQSSRKWGWFSNTFSGKYIVFPEDYNVPSVPNIANRIGIVTPIYYDTFYGNVIKANYNEEGVIPQMYNRCKEMINAYSYSFASPFVKYVVSKYDYKSLDEYGYVDDDVELSALVSQDNLKQTSNTVDGYLYNNSHYNQWTDWGGSPKNNGTDYTIKKHQFQKMTTTEINNISWGSDAQRVPSDYGGNYLASMKGLYCQILTGFWLRREDDNYSGINNVTGIRKNGYFYQTLQFDTKYHFGYDLSNLQLLNDLLSSDTSICYTYNQTKTKIIPVQVKDYWAMMSANLQPTTKIKNADLDKLTCACQIRVISGVFSI